MIVYAYSYIHMNKVVNVTTNICHTECLLFLQSDMYSHWNFCGECQYID